MSLLNLPKCEHRKFNSDKNEIFCKRDNCIKLVEDCLECMMKVT